MGQWHRFTCPECNYEKECSIGVDRGFYAEVKPMVCKECSELNNITIGEFDDKNNHIKYGKLECPDCGSSKLKNWIKQVCPKCGTKMNFSDRKAILWD